MKFSLKRDPDVGNNLVAISCKDSELSRVLKCQRQFWALPIIGAACWWLHITGKVRLWLPISVLQWP